MKNFRVKSNGPDGTLIRGFVSAPDKKSAKKAAPKGMERH